MLKSLLMAAVLGVPLCAQAATVLPVSYSYQQNPNSGGRYLDDGYSGTLGELTDGELALAGWRTTDSDGFFAIVGPNVGFEGINPRITFVFDQAYDFGTITLYTQDTRGRAGVGLIDSFSVTSSTPGDVVTSPTLVSPNTPDPNNDPIFRPTLAVSLNISALEATDRLTLDIVRGDTFVFLSEVTFAEAAPVPLPAGLPLLLAGIGALGVMRRRG